MAKPNIFKNVQDFGNIFNKIHSNDKDCDFIIKTKDQEDIKVHKVIIKAVSPYLKALINAKRKKKKSAITFPEIDSRILRQIVDYMYTGEIEINDDNAQLLLAASQLFQIKWIVDRCSEYLKESVNISSSLTIRRFADLHSCKDLLKYCRDYMIEHFEELPLDFFFKLSYAEFKDIISSDDLCVGSEEIIYKVVIGWIQHDVDNRNMYLTQLLSHVRFSLIKEAIVLKHCPDEQLLTFQLITAVKKQLCLKGEHGKNIEHVRHRKSKTNIFIVGKRCQMYDSSWISISVPNMEISKASNCLVTVNKKVYAFGLNQEYSICAELFDPLTNEWSRLPDMSTKDLSYNLNACVLGHLIYVCGWSSFSKNILYVYDTETSKWKEGFPMPFSGITKSVVVQNAIYYFGESVSHRFDIRESQWKYLTLNTKRSGLCVVPDKTYAYCIGGKINRNNVLGTVERYDVRNNKWELLADMHSARFDHAAIIKDNYIHVLGGRGNHSDCATTVEIYKPLRNKWIVLDNVKINFPEASAVTLNTN